MVCGVTLDVMFERFTDEARRLFIASEQLARASGSAEVDPVHLMVALLRDPTVGEVAKEAGLDVDRAVEELADPEEGEGSPDLIAPSAASRQLFEDAESTAAELGHMAVTPQDLFLALLGNTDQPAMQPLARQGDLNTIRERVIASIPAEPPTGEAACEKCGAPTSSQGKVRKIDLKVEGHEAISVYAYFCGSCGSTYGLVKAPPEEVEEA